MSPAIKKMRSELKKRIEKHRKAARVCPPTVAAQHASVVLTLKELHKQCLGWDK